MLSNTFAPELLALFFALTTTFGSPVHWDIATTQPDVCLDGTANVTFRGSSKSSVESFRNIRFGQDTSDANRFASPRPYTYPANNIYDANRPGAACPQQRVPLPGIPLFDNVTNISEDCLTLRVDRPSGTRRDAKLPVMVYIYGGGDTIGQIYDEAYDPGALVLASVEKHSPVIYAAMNYRVGIFGFAASSALRAADSLNVGLLDQRLGLEWIKENIAAFGGDPDRVTIFGESDGATGVGLQITAYGGQVESVPFQRAILQSGGPTADPGTASNVSAEHTAQVVQLTNCTAATDEADLSCLRKLPLSTLLEIAVAYETSVVQWGFDVFIPTAPSSFIPDSPSRLLRSGQFARGIDIISGWNEDDGSLFTLPTLQSDTDVAEFLLESFPGLTNASVRNAMRLYPTVEFETVQSNEVSPQYFRASRMYRDATFSCPSLLMVQSNRRHHQGRHERAPSDYLYALNQTVFAASYAAENASFYGVAHFSDIPFVFDQASTRYAAVASPADKALASEMCGSWIAFAATGKVERDDVTLNDWPASGTADDVRVIGGSRPRYMSGHDYEQLASRCEFWNSPLLTEQLEV